MLGDTVSAPGSGRGFVGSLRDGLPLTTTVFARPRRDTRPLAGATALFSQQHGAPGALGGVVRFPVQPAPVQQVVLYDL